MFGVLRVLVSDLWFCYWSVAHKKSYKTEISFYAVIFVIRILQGSQSSSWNWFGVLVGFFFFFW